MTPPGRIGAAAALAALAWAAAGCSGASTGSHAASGAVDPYKASLAFAKCMREHGVPHPDPDRAGNFHLTPHDEELMRKVSPRKHELAEEACFHHLKGAVSTKPLSAHAKALAVKALEDFSSCMRKRGYDLFADPVVRNMSRGRAFFGFKKSDPALMKVQRTAAFKHAQHACEQSLN